MSTAEIPPLRSIYFYLTEGCNLRCRHCWIAPKYQSEESEGIFLDKALFESIIEQGKELGLSNVKLTGGEPLIHPQFEELIDIIQKENPGFSMETNGVLITKELAKRIQQIENPFVAVSLDATEPETHEWIRGVEGCFEKTVKGIQNLVDAGIRTQVIMTLMKINRDQIEKMIRFCESLGVNSLKINITQPVVRGKSLHEQEQVLQIGELIQIGRWVETELCKQTNLNLYYSHPVAFRPLSRIYGEKGVGCGICGIKKILGVLHDGSYALCGIGSNVPEMVFGHAETDRMEQIWRESKVLNEIRTHLPERLEGICGECLMKNICLGTCLAYNYYSSKSLWTGYWFCELAHEKGLFPETRLRNGFN
jgi:SynChlorMet cassette radical SAM/SPASM protein ScmF